MDSTVIDVGPVLFLVLAALTLFAATVFGLTRLGSGPAVARAAVRAVLQLGVVSLIIVAVLASWWSTGAFIAVMYVVASVTSARRINSRRARWAAAVPIGFGVFPALGLLVASHALPATPLAVLPTAGILTGGAMTATTLAGRRALDELHARHGEYEAGLALGFGERDAVLEVCRTSAGQALVPALDQTRTVGLVTLPGAFVGVLLGGASPIQAGATQLLILIALLAVETAAIAATVELIARGVLRR
ncbi:ABC transporter permease [Plantactinospora soyae]|uniref:ABC transport system permease protein n=1 Tax=Plantactinospora soyae TaxID=1544732 RepID=A0A927R8V4_9ACTN|nr:ABC transporter permease [Plantactinospora soyae]MBE1490784.1 putative ABC transport system permease protein [Plantactinospora soyae]